MNNQSPILFCKANAQLQLALLRLLQESGHHWVETMQQLSTGCVLETNSRIQNLQQATDWQSLAALPSSAFGCLYKGRMKDVQTIGQATAKSQTAFADGLRLALTTWQNSVSSAFGTSFEPTPFVQFYQSWLQPWVTPAVASQSEAKNKE